MLKVEQDAYGQALLAYMRGENSYEIVEREDGWVGVSAGAPAYFANYSDWPVFEQKAIRYAHGRVLDIGCGAGRVGIYLQDKGLKVLGVDNSPGALEVCRMRGYTDTSPTPVTRISQKLGAFDTIVMFGNNFGLFANVRRARYLLKRFHRMTRPGALILASSNDVYQTEQPDHLAYHQLNRQRGRMPGQIRFRVRFAKFKTPWFDYLMVSPEEMKMIVEGTGWVISQFIQEPDRSVYLGILQKA